MAFGRRKSEQTATEESTDEPKAVSAAAVYGSEPEQDRPDGPFDIEDFDDPEEALVARLDLGSVLIPMPPGGQVQVELNPTGVPSAIWVVTPNGRFTIAAYAAPKSPGLWREVASELADALRNDSAAVSIQDGPWGREVVGTGAGVVRFIGVDGYRWMIRCVVNGAQESMEALVAEAREALEDTVIRRGDTPMPARTPLPVQLPPELAAQLQAAATQQAQQAQQAMLAAQQAMLAQRQVAQQQFQQPPMPQPLTPQPLTPQPLTPQPPTQQPPVSPEEPGEGAASG
ncbi:MAG: DUF3710 domain-containing protein [Mycobacteriaceae bacterium]